MFSSALFFGWLGGEKMHRVRHVWAQVRAVAVFFLPFASLKAMAKKEQRKKQQRSSGSSMGSDESWLMVGSPVAKEEPPAASVSAVAEEDPYSEPAAAYVAAVAVAPPLAAVAVAPFGAAVALEDAAPAAIAAGAQPDPQGFDLNYFRSFRPFTDTYKQHNAALKWFRGQQELQDDPMQSPCLQFHVSTPTAVAVINHASKGMTWEFTDERTQWSWHELVAQLDEASMEEVVNGPAFRSRGLVGCSFAIRPGSYDHKRSHMLIKSGAPIQHKLPYWDFVIHRADGSGIRLHPSWSKTFVETLEEPVHAEALAVVTVPPRRGLGRSDGRGTYAKYKNIEGTKQMRFDAAKKP